ncbi:MAG TPA: Rieske (2Fe-2S) protein [Nitrospirae bacterium]|nr:cytochrome b6-f complex iron-sulfur subunit [bacterium BMS3Abin06]HDH12305.1 Rieske (2Fe-2S) protein [Nitrospirota bacterium]HDZ00812.1 Rieske (2Fe-2S) protein [Nitrospirota bacterium]
MTTNIHEKKINRRLVLKIAGFGSFFITLGISLVGSIRFLYPRVLFEQPSTFKIGFPSEFKIEQDPDKNGVLHIYEAWKKEHSVWIVRGKSRIYALHSRCTHLGCTPNWFADEGVFKCPCHGSRFYSNGVNFAGPAPRPLDRFRIYVNAEGVITIDKSMVYTYKDFDKTGAYLEI